MLTLGWSWLDPVTALLVGVVVAAGAFALLRDSFNATMDAVPDSVDQAAVQAFLGAQPGVSAVHHLHIWALGSDEVAMTAHLVREDAGDHDAFLARVAHELAERFGIHHPQLQIERTGDCHPDPHRPCTCLAPSRRGSCRCGFSPDPFGAGR